MDYMAEGKFGHESLYLDFSLSVSLKLCELEAQGIHEMSKVGEVEVRAKSLIGGQSKPWERHLFIRSVP